MSSSSSRAAAPAVARQRVAPHGCILDDGAQYLKTPDDTPEVRRLVLEELPRDGLVDIGRPVWTFDRAGRVASGDPAQNAEPKWTYTAGLDTLGGTPRRGAGRTPADSCGAVGGRTERLQAVRRRRRCPG